MRQATEYRLSWLANKGLVMIDCDQEPNGSEKQLDYQGQGHHIKQRRGRD